MTSGKSKPPKTVADARAPMLAQPNAAERLELLERILDVIPSLVSYIGADRRYLYVNRGYEDRFARPRGEIVGHTL
jgi:PAS domain-containing protein